jgi:hypothetical protein
MSRSVISYDQEAIRITQQDVDGRAIELWDRAGFTRDWLLNRPRSSAPAMYSVQELRAYADEHLDWARTARTDRESAGFSYKWLGRGLRSPSDLRVCHTARGGVWTPV